MGDDHHVLKRAPGHETRLHQSLLDGDELIEAAKGSPLSDRAQLIGQQMGIALVLLLMTLAVYNDLARIFG